MALIAEQEPRITGEADDEESVELIDYLRIMWSHRWLIGMGTAAAVVLAALYGLTAPKSYQASLLLKVGTAFTAADSNDTRLRQIEDPKTIAQVLTGDAMLDKLRAHLALDGLSVGALRGALKVQVVKNDFDVASTALVELKLTLPDPPKVVDGLAFLAETLIAEHAPLYSAGLAIIDREQASLKEKIRVNETQQETLKRQIADLRVQVAAESKFRETLDRNIARVEGEVSQARARLAEAKPDAADALWEQTLFQSRQVHLDQLYRERNESELRGAKARADIYSVESTATYLTGQRVDYENRIVELDAFRTRSQNTQVRSTPVLPTAPVAPNKTLLVAMALVLGLFGSILTAFLIEYVRTARQRRLFGGPVFRG
ncbi:MAG: Wzz/FepE/Etk N-terminal domain-containing protein [Nitrospirota bacterium]